MSLFSFIVILFCILNENDLFAEQKTVTFATSEREPYIGSQIKENGYVAKLVSEAYKRVGYNVMIDYYPLARAKTLAENGKVDGLLPTNYDKSNENVFSYSNSFPGVNIVLLKKKSFNVKIKEKSLKEILQKLNKYSFGIVRGLTVSQEFDNANFLKKEYAATEIQNIDKLMHDGVNFIITDKFTAADIIVKQRPNYIGKIDVIKPSIISHPFHIAFSKKSENYKKIQSDFNQGLKMISDDGTLTKILNTHGIFTSKASKNGKTKITIGAVKNYQMLIMQKLSKEFENKNSNIELDWRIMDENILRQRILSDLLIEDGQFDVFAIGSYETPIWAKKNWLAPVKNIPENYKLEDILIHIRNSLSLNKKLYSLPFYAESSMLFYRDDLIKKAKINISLNPTYDDIFKFAKAIHDPTHKVYGICLRGSPGWGANIAYFSTLVNTVGGRWFDENWKPTIDTQEWRQAMQIYKDLLTKYGPPNPWMHDYNTNLEMFQNGHCGMWIDATVFAAALIDPKLSKVSKQVGFANAPVAKTAKGSHWLWIWGLGIPTTSKLQNEAQKFITWATSPEYTELVSKKEGLLAVPPGTRSSIYKNNNYKAVAPFADITLNAIETANPKEQTLLPVPYSGIQYISIPEFPAIGIKVGELLSDVLAEKLTIEQALKEAQKFVTVQMRASGYVK